METSDSYQSSTAILSDVRTSSTFRKDNIKALSITMMKSTHTQYTPCISFDICSMYNVTVFSDLIERVIVFKVPHWNARYRRQECVV